MPQKTYEKPEAGGRNRYKYFRRPIIPFLPQMPPNVLLAPTRFVFPTVPPLHKLCTVCDCSIMDVMPGTYTLITSRFSAHNCLFSDTVQCLSGSSVDTCCVLSHNPWCLLNYKQLWLYMYVHHKFTFCSITESTHCRNDESLCTSHDLVYYSPTFRYTEQLGSAFKIHGEVHCTYTTEHACIYTTHTMLYMCIHWMSINSSPVCSSIFGALNACLHTYYTPACIGIVSVDHSHVYTHDMVLDGSWRI